MTERERNLIKSNLKAFVHNFGTVRIEKENCGKGFYVFYPYNSRSLSSFNFNLSFP